MKQPPALLLSGKKKFSCCILMAAFFALAIFYACEKDKSIEEQVPPGKGIFKMEFRMTAAGAPFELYEEFVNTLGLRTRVEELRFYVSDIMLFGQEEPILLKDIALIDFAEKDKLYITAPAPPGKYNAIGFGIGVPKRLNGTDNPDFDVTQYPNEHPLSIYANTYWTWNTGYRFIMLAGKMDTTQSGTGNIVYPFVYETGLDTLYRKKMFSYWIEVNKGDTAHFNITMDFNDFLYSNGDTLDIVTNNYTHTTDHFAAAQKLTDHFVQALKKY